MKLVILPSLPAPQVVPVDAVPRDAPAQPIAPRIRNQGRIRTSRAVGLNGEPLTTHNALAKILDAVVYVI